MLVSVGPVELVAPAHFQLVPVVQLVGVGVAVEQLVVVAAVVVVVDLDMAVVVAVGPVETVVVVVADLVEIVVVDLDGLGADPAGIAVDLAETAVDQVDPVGIAVDHVDIAVDPVGIGVDLVGTAVDLAGTGVVLAGIDLVPSDAADTVDSDTVDLDIADIDSDIVHMVVADAADIHLAMGTTKEVELRAPLPIPERTFSDLLPNKLSFYPKIQRSNEINDIIPKLSDTTFPIDDSQLLLGDKMRITP